MPAFILLLAAFCLERTVSKDDVKWLCAFGVLIGASCNTKGLAVAVPLRAFFPYYASWSTGGGSRPVERAAAMSLPILLVTDDDRNMRLMLTRLLETSFHIVTAASGAETLQAIETNRPDVVLIDMMLPDITGIDLLERIHERDPALPVIVLSGVAKGTTAQEALQRGAFDYVLKPVEDFDAFEDLLTRAVQYRRSG